MHILYIGEVPLWDIESRVQSAGGVQGDAASVSGIARKHDCALPAQYTKHSNARGVTLGLKGGPILYRQN